MKSDTSIEIIQVKLQSDTEYKNKEPVFIDGDIADSEQNADGRILTAINETSNEHSKSKSQLATLKFTQMSDTNLKDGMIYKITEQRYEDHSEIKKRSFSSPDLKPS
jgi:hypothetical protein